MATHEIAHLGIGYLPRGARHIRELSAEENLAAAGGPPAAA